MTTLRVMTWNVQNLFEPGAEDGPPTEASFEAKLSSLAAVVDTAQPHVLALQEIGPESALVRLQTALSHTMPHRLVGEPDARGIRVALLSQRVLSDRVGLRAFPDELLPVQTGDDPPGSAGPATMNQLGRGALQATIRAGNREVHVMVCHLKSKLLTFPGGRFSPHDEGERARFAAYALYRRTGEATTLRDHLNEMLRGAGEKEAVVLAGDMNDDPTAATTQILNGPPGSEIGTVGYERPDQGDGDRMWNLAPLIPENERFTRRYRGRGELIDHIFVSHHLVQRAVAAHTIAATAQLPSITDDPRERRSEPGSDHAAVIATFDLDD
jgi:endonuclease/exonuclease/phosphatase family metal-dependent hydrolase